MEMKTFHLNNNVLWHEDIQANTGNASALAWLLWLNLPSVESQGETLANEQIIEFFRVIWSMPRKSKQTNQSLHCHILGEMQDLEQKGLELMLRPCSLTNFVVWFYLMCHILMYDHYSFKKKSLLCLLSGNGFAWGLFHSSFLELPLFVSCCLDYLVPFSSFAMFLEASHLLLCPWVPYLPCLCSLTPTIHPSLRV